MRGEPPGGRGDQPLAQAGARAGPRRDGRPDPDEAVRVAHRQDNGGGDPLVEDERVAHPARRSIESAPALTRSPVRRR